MFDNELKRLKTDLKKTHDLADSRVQQDQIELLYAELSKYCNYEDLKDLYKKVLPPILTFQKQMQELND